jgi:hypothetical protein
MSATDEPVSAAPPIACLLPEDALQARGEDLAANLFQGVQQVQELPDGYAFAFPGAADWIARLGAFVAAERECCPFFRFELVFAPPHDTIWLRLRGASGVKEFIQQEFSGLLR